MSQFVWVILAFGMLLCHRLRLGNPEWESGQRAHERFKFLLPHQIQVFTSLIVFAVL